MALLDSFGSDAPSSPLVRQCLDEMRGMVDTTERMFRAATATLLDNEPLDLDLGALDETVNDREQSIRRAMLHHVTIDPQRDLLLSLTLLIIVQEAERIGDLSKSLAKAAELATAPRVGQSVHPLRRVRDRVQGLFPDVRLGFIQADARAARRVMEAHTSVKVEVADFLALIAEGEIADTNRAVVLAIAARMIGRVSSHLSNIASSVVLPFDQVRNAPTWDDTGA
ncbi:MAG: PhoU domain-containing protein [Bacteroidota bacterium]